MNAWVQSLISALVGGIIGGLAVGISLDAADETPKPRADPRSARPTSDNDGMDDERLTALENEVRRLRKENATVRSLREYGKAMAEAEGDAGAKRINPVIDAEDPVFELAVRSVYDRLEEERREERRVRRAQRTDQRARWQADFVAERLDLPPDVRDRLQRLMIDQMEKFQQLRHGDPDAGIERPQSRAEWRERVDAIRKQTDEQMAGILTEEQLEAYRKLREEEGFDQRGGRRGRGGP